MNEKEYPPAGKIKSFISKLAQTLAIMLAASYAFSLFARFGWRLDNFSSFTHQYIIGCLALIPALYLFHERRFAALMLLILLLNAAEARPHPDSFRASDSMPKFTVMEYNSHLSQTEHNTLKAILLKKPADAVILQEANAPLIKVSEEISGIYPFRIIEPRPNPWGADWNLMILSAHPIESTEIVPLYGPSWKNSAIRATIRAPGLPQPIILYALHALPPIGKPRWMERNLELKGIARRIAEDDSPYMIFAGDLNITPFSPFFKDLLRETRLNHNFRGVWTPPTWHANLKFPIFQIPIDHILYSDKFVMLSQKTLAPMGFDHKPLIATFAAMP